MISLYPNLHIIISGLRYPIGSFFTCTLLVGLDAVVHGSWNVGMEELLGGFARFEMLILAVLRPLARISGSFLEELGPLPVGRQSHS